MKVNLEKIEITESYYNKNNNLIQGELNNVHENIKLSPMVYNSKVKGLFKLVLVWNFIMKSIDQTFNILILDAEQTFVMQLNNDNDKETLKKYAGYISNAF